MATNFPLSDLLGQTKEGGRALKFKGEVESGIQDITLQTPTTSPGNGTEFDVGAFRDLTIEIYGSSTNRTIVFEAAGPSGVFKPIPGFRTLDFEMATQTTGNNESWSFDITGQKKFRAKITAVVGGNVTIKGTAVA